MYECEKCKKPTRSHVFVDRAVCHACWLEMDEYEKTRFEQYAWSRIS